MLENLFGLREKETEEHWISISDVMAGLMVIFLFIAISYMVHINRATEQKNRTTEQIKGKFSAYKNLRGDLSAKLHTEFEGTTIKKTQFRSVWRGHLDVETLSIRFKNPFPSGVANVPASFKNILSKFFPRYIAVLTKYRDKIDEIRIEGHTSSVWQGESELERDYSREDAVYLENMKLSQNRARNVLKHVLGINQPQIGRNKNWIKKNLTANGLSSSQLILNPDGTENKEESRRVEFRVVTKSEKLIDEIQKLLQEFSNTEVIK